MTRSSKSSALKQGKQVLRIIGGEWRGRKLHFAAVKDCRPTPDRVRETLFNWLMHKTHGAHCLDLFSGSGALGLEALSRGAAHVLFVDIDADAIKSLEKTLKELNTDRYTLKNMDCHQFLQDNQQRFDIVFFDPPYQAAVYETCSAQLEQTDALSSEALIYIEHGGDLSRKQLPQEWQQLKEKSSGQVHYELYQRSLCADDAV